MKMMLHLQMIVLLTVVMCHWNVTILLVKEMMRILTVMPRWLLVIVYNRSLIHNIFLSVR